MRRFPFLLLIQLSIFLITAAGLQSCQEVQSYNTASLASVIPDVFDESWAGGSYWEDGKAEVAIYEAQRFIYGRPRDFEYTFATVKETFNEEYKVKTDNYRRDDLFDVMKLNMFARIPTENYPYHFLTSVFHLRDDPGSMYKMTHSSQEWCGNVFKSFLQSDQGFKYDWHSYWDNQGDGSTSIKQEVLFEDALPYSLRSLKFEEGLNFTSNILRSEINSKAYAPKILKAEFNVAAEEIKDATGKAYKCWKVEVNHQQSATYWFQADYPNTMIRMEHEDGRKLLLKSLKRWAYWNM